jgi:hypothetical protein
MTVQRSRTIVQYCAVQDSHASIEYSTTPTPYVAAPTLLNFSGTVN